MPKSICTLGHSNAHCIWYAHDERSETTKCSMFAQSWQILYGFFSQFALCRSFFLHFNEKTWMFNSMNIWIKLSSNFNCNLLMKWREKKRSVMPTDLKINKLVSAPWFGRIYSTHDSCPLGGGGGEDNQFEAITLNFKQKVAVIIWSHRIWWQFSMHRWYPWTDSIAQSQEK